MSVLTSVKKAFTKIFVGSEYTSTDRISASAEVTSELVAYLLALSDFSGKMDEEIYEQLLVWEPEVGGAIDRLATLAGESFKYFYLRQPDKAETDIEKKCIEDANDIAREMNMKTFIEMVVETLMTQGNVFCEWVDEYTIAILPNKSVTIIDRQDRIENAGSDTILQPNFLVLNEPNTETRRVLPKDKFAHIKYKDTPVWTTDHVGRPTFGIYSISPLHRTVLTVWWKRQTQIIDILWRYRNVPREHHQFSADMFSLDKYTGDVNARRQAARDDAKKILDEYVLKLKKQAPDQGYVTLDTTKIGFVEGQGKAGYMQTNELVEQLNESLWIALNVPKSIISGATHGSYASELIVTNYVMIKVLQMADKVKPLLLQMMKARLRRMNAAYPVDDLDVKFELILSSARLELFRQIAIMGQLGIFTDTEIREVVGFEALREDQKKNLVMTKGMSFPGTPGSTDGYPEYPETSQSKTQHSTDAGSGAVKRAEQP